MTASRMLKSAKRHDQSLEEDIAGVPAAVVEDARAVDHGGGEIRATSTRSLSQYLTNTAFQSLKPGLMEGSELKKEGGWGVRGLGF